MKKPTPQELEQLRAAYPKGSPRFDYREMELVIVRAPADDAADGAGDDDAMVRIAISSEQPVLRYDWWTGEEYYEVLAHDRESVDLSYARDGLPFIASHRSWDADSQHGIVENITVDKDRVLRGDVRFSRAGRSQEIRQDMIDGIRKKVSVGYIVGAEYTQTDGKGKDAVPTRRYTDWMPVEASTVPIPADYTVGVERAASQTGQVALARFLELHPRTTPQDPSAPLAAAVPSQPAPQATQERTMPDTGTAPAGATTTTDNTAAAATTSNVSVQRDESDAQRITNIRNLGTQHGIPSDQVQRWIGEGTTEQVVTQRINGILAERIARPMQQATPIEEIIPETDWQRFSFARAILLGSAIQDEQKFDYGFEREVLQEVERSSGMFGAQRGGNRLPFGLLGRTSGIASKGRGKRLPSISGRAGVDSGVTTTGGPFKFAQPGEFIPLLRNKMSVMRAGASVFSGLTGPLTFPKQTGATSGVWKGENSGSDVTASNLTTTTVTLAFKSVGVNTAFSRQMLFSAASGNYDIEQLIQNDIAVVLALAGDLVALKGGGSNEPSGVLANTSIGSVTLGTNGGTVAYNDIVDLETKVGQANADTTRMAYITNAAQRARLKKVAVLGSTNSGIPVWTGGTQNIEGQVLDGTVNGYRALQSEQVPSNLTKGTATTICSAIVFGAFEHLLIGYFGNGVETIVDPYSKKFQGMVEVAMWQYMDVQCRHNGAFAAIQDAL